MGRKLRALGITPTTQRVTIAALLLKKHQHLTADEVLAQVNTARKRVSKATVYNTLGLFARKGLIRALSVGSESTFYDTNTRPHGHFYDPQTKQISDLSDDQLSLRLSGELPPGSEVERVDLIVHLRKARRN